MRTLRLLIAYDGTEFAGWQRQANAIAIQQVVEEAFAPLNDGVAVTIAGAGRTDSGVHALGQVASVNVEFSHSANAVWRALNVRLPPAIRVLDVAEAEPGFHAQFDATGKSYRYRIATTPVQSPFDRAFTWHVPWALDVTAMRRAAARFIGTHDFASLQASGTLITDRVRTLERLDVVTDVPGEIQILAEGDGFLRTMVRVITGTLVEVGSGKRAPESMTDILAAKHRDAAGETAPPQGLTLVSVRY
jgi:tRNA pseudouridine38-40 synthase